VTISLSLVWKANLPPSHAAVNTVFKGLSVFATAFAATRFAILYTTSATEASYARLTFWLVIEAASAIILASITAYRIVVLESLTKNEAQLQLAGLPSDEDRLVAARSRDCRGNAVTITAPLPRS